MGLILILAWMYSTSELDELFQILNLIEKDLNLKGLEPHWSNTTRPYPMREQKKVIQNKMDRLEHLGIIQKGLTGYSSPVVLVKQKNQNLY